MVIHSGDGENNGNKKLMEKERLSAEDRVYYNKIGKGT